MAECFLRRMSRRPLPPSVVLAFSVTTFSGLHAQTTSDAVHRAQLLRHGPTINEDPYNAVTGDDSGTAAASPNDADLGEQAILKRQERYRPFTAGFALPVSYTSNVALTRSGERGDVVIAPVAGVSYAPQ